MPPSAKTLPNARREGKYGVAGAVGGHDVQEPIARLGDVHVIDERHAAHVKVTPSPKAIRPVVTTSP